MADTSTVQDIFLVDGWVGVLLAVVMQLGLVGLYAPKAKAVGILGLIGLVIAFVGIMLTMGASFAFLSIGRSFGPGKPKSTGRNHCQRYWCLD